MQGFKEFFSDMAFHMSQDPDGPSALEAIQDVFDINKTIKIIDLILGASKMILMLKPTLKTNLDILENLGQALRHPKKSKYWKKLARSIANSGKLTLANPLVLFPAITPAIASLSPSNQAIVLGTLKVLSSTYFYLTALADKGVENPAINELLAKIKPLLTDTGLNQSDKS